jgi:hypothetical protein
MPISFLLPLEHTCLISLPGDGMNTCREDTAKHLGAYWGNKNIIFLFLAWFTLPKGQNPQAGN